MDGTVPRGIAAGTTTSVESACRAELVDRIRRGVGDLPPAEAEAIQWVRSQLIQSLQGLSGCPLEWEAGAPAEAGNETEGTAAAEDPVERLRRMIDERQDETMQILESWMDESPAGAGRI